ncbi:MAG: hypothetical protein ACUVRG_04650 [Ignavibacterium sp.]|uniref:hypothetical protein n=1 Tax=Ignavibacterium sp. TaxID=2651167 RepID=UPI004049B98C
MSIENILSLVNSSPFIILSKDELNAFLEASVIIKEVDTSFSDYIRILKYNDDYFFQEMSDKDEILLRKMNSLEEAEQLLKERLDFYDRMWDGCGCKINYYE